MEPHGACGLQPLVLRNWSVCGVAACWAVVITRSDWRIGYSNQWTTFCFNNAISQRECSCGRGSLGSDRSEMRLYGSYLVDPASSHMLVSKIKPCMSKYKPLYGETANGSLKQLSSP